MWFPSRQNRVELSLGMGTAPSGVPMSRVRRRLARHPLTGCGHQRAECGERDDGAQSMVGSVLTTVLWREGRTCRGVSGWRDADDVPRWCDIPSPTAKEPIRWPSERNSP